MSDHSQRLARKPATTTTGRPMTGATHASADPVAASPIATHGALYHARPALTLGPPGQNTLTISTPGDPIEREAERVAGQVTAAAIGGAGPVSGSVPKQLAAMPAGVVA
ncbi:MAG: hypothetical protein KDG58_02225, partial [Anaerolineae bacterium]|nr:hypothetical protein [Anaerolineae bacterium]